MRTLLALASFAALSLACVALWRGSESLGLPSWITDTVLLMVALATGIGMLVVLDARKHRRKSGSDAERRRRGSAYSRGA